MIRGIWGSIHGFNLLQKGGLAGPVRAELISGPEFSPQPDPIQEENINMLCGLNGVAWRDVYQNLDHIIFLSLSSIKDTRGQSYRHVEIKALTITLATDSSALGNQEWSGHNTDRIARSSISRLIKMAPLSVPGLTTIYSTMLSSGNGQLNHWLTVVTSREPRGSEGEKWSTERLSSTWHEGGDDSSPCANPNPPSTLPLNCCVPAMLVYRNLETLLCPSNILGQIANNSQFLDSLSELCGG
ncbi:hypothetical protein RRG08_023291 [Elysia crispata]|uniref:Uncharacterized protein n=1 Tax=Elysia crispata TaxID=231223 RepID=A0AAE1BC27_9GAST|nr:hypothetical protein RRG08_023291 [Elysia crispata]